ncbi:MAG: hypothetical protein ACKO51_09565 [Alphaproteobacteria bacterium]
MVTAEKHHFIRDLTIGGMMAEDLAIVTKLPVFWGQLSNFTADRCALPACGRSAAIARSWIRSAIQGSVMGDIREGLDSGFAVTCENDGFLACFGSAT